MEAGVGGKKKRLFVASKVICLRNNIGCSYLRLKGNVAVQKCTTKIKLKINIAIKLRNDAMQLFCFTFN